MRPLCFSLFNSARDNCARPETRTWEEWIPTLTAHTQRGEPADATDKTRLDLAKDGPALVLGGIAPGGKHTNEAVQEVNALGLDIENCTEDRLVAAFKALLPFEFVAYSTHKHAAPAGNLDPALRTRLRVIVPLAKPLNPSRHARAWQLLDLLTGKIADRKTRNVGRLFYLPTTYDLSVAWAQRNPGVWFDPETQALPEGAVASGGPGSDRLRELLRNMPGNTCTDAGLSLKDAARRVLEGEPIAPAGDRHETTLALTLWLVRKTGSKAAPPVADAQAVFAASLAAARFLDPQAPGERDLAAAWEGAVVRVAGWEAERQDQAFQHQLDALGAGAGKLGKYEEADLARIAVAGGVPFVDGAAAQALQRRWIIQAGDQAYYLLGADGNYRGPYGAAMGRTAAVEVLARAPVLLNEPTPRGFRRRPLQELAEDYGTAISTVVVDLTATRTIFDEAHRTIYEAARPLRTELAPLFDPQIDQWLHLLAGSNHEKLNDWLACVPDLTRLLCALYLSGGPATGKTLLAMGLARLWSEAPAQFELAMAGSFNDELLRNPLILADEDLGQSRWRKQDLTGQIRSMLSTLERTVTRKYLPPAALRGAVRLVLAANNDYLLSSSGSTSHHDVEALSQRFLYLKVPQAAADFLATVPRATKELWKAEGIARHARWLQANREVKPGKRFWVEGDVTQMSRLVTISNDWSARVCEWLVRFLINPAPYAARADGLVRLGKGRLLVNEQGIIDGWKLYLPDTRVEPETAKVGSALRSISGDERPIFRCGKKKERRRFRDITVDTLMAWAEQNGLGDREAMLATLWDGETPPGEREPGGDDELEGVTMPAINAGGDPF